MHLYQALAAKVPVIRVENNDPINLETLIREQRPKLGFSNFLSYDPSQIIGDNERRTIVAKPSTLIYCSATMDDIPSSLYTALSHNGSVLLIVGDKAAYSYPHVYDAGAYLPTDAELSLGIQRCRQWSAVDSNRMVPSLRGLTLLQADLVTRVALSAAQHSQSINHDFLVNVRSSILGSANGLSVLSRDDRFYAPCPELTQWATNSGRALAKIARRQDLARLRPRGCLLTGLPGTGKTAAASYISRFLNIPLLRLDITAMLTRWQGDAEQSMAVALRVVETLSPCVVLIDEVEKIIRSGSTGGSSDTINRMLSQILWWMATNQSLTLVVMTSNDHGALPPELYRDGRLDEVINVPEIGSNEELVPFIQGVLGQYSGVTVNTSALDFGQAPYNQAAVVKTLERAIIEAAM